MTGVQTCALPISVAALNEEIGAAAAAAGWAFVDAGAVLLEPLQREGADYKIDAIHLRADYSNEVAAVYLDLLAEVAGIGGAADPSESKAGPVDRDGNAAAAQSRRPGRRKRRSSCTIAFHGQRPGRALPVDRVTAA